MIISIDQRLVTAASLVWETFSDQDAQDHYWNLTFSLTARVRDSAIAVGTMIHFLVGLRDWLRGLDHEDIEHYQLALPEGSISKLLCPAPVGLEEMNPWDELVDVVQATLVPVVDASSACLSPQLLLAPAKQPAKRNSGRKKQQGAKTATKTKTRSRTKTKTHRKTAIAC